ncbi:hypothetical protein [Streptomyces sp. NBC_01174]|uniref:hypothetical protein n=1 Tax=Streptomyces sp. NBC_01174 TaxID=2903758 RepID=UPI002F91BD70|nr:hypothetical protein OG414_40255 [Streptomyces sp. NBC_01174]
MTVPPHTGVKHDHSDETHPLRGNEAAIEAVLTADAVLIAAFPGTLSPAIAPLAWTGYPPAEGLLPYPACAVAYLGSADHIHGWWLHYTQRHDQLGEVQHVLTLVAPCACGTYLHRELPDEITLNTVLDALDTAPGAPVTCEHRLSIRSASHADHDHNSFEPPL